MERQSGDYEQRPAPEGSHSRMTPLNHYLAPLKPGRAVLLWGEPVRLLAAAAAAWGAAKEAQVLVVDAANRFDPYQLVRQARGYGLAPAQALARVQVARAFTSHQLVRLLKEILPAALKPGALVVILGPVSLFYDEQVPMAERRRLFKDLTRLLGSIKSQGALLLLQPRLPKAAANQHFGRLLAPVVDYMVRVREEEIYEGRAGGVFCKRSPTLPSNSPPQPPVKIIGGTGFQPVLGKTPLPERRRL